MEVIGHLPAEERDYVLHIIENTDLSLEDKVAALDGLSDIIIKEKCIKYLTLLENFMNKIPNEQKEMVRSILIEESLSLNEKMTALEDTMLDWQTLKDGMKLLVNMQSSKLDSYQGNHSVKVDSSYGNRPVKPDPPKESQKTPKKKDPSEKIPDITDFPFLEEISDKKRAEQIKAILLDDSLMDLEIMKQKLSEIVTDKKEAKEIKKFLLEMRNEADLLDQLPKAARPDVASILREITMNLSEKREALRCILKDREDRKRCRDYLQEKIAEKEGNVDEELEDDETPPGYRNFFENAPKVMNILILGETGVGKSTFINGLANYLKFQNLREAKNSRKVEIMISTYFTLTDQNFNQRKITCLAKDGSGNENMDDGTSATLSAKPYVFQWGLPGQEKQIRLIDTPGVGDVAGFAKDKANFDNIFTHLADYKELHAVCILLKPNESKLNTTFTYCLGELLSRLHVSARKNILFCFTNTRGTLYRPGETSAILTSFMKEIEKKRGIEIAVNRPSMFCFDNESFRFLCAWKEGVTFPKDHVANFNGSWKRSVEETFRFFTRVSQLRPHNVAETLAANNVRMAFNILARPMASLQKKEQTQDKVIQGIRQEIAELEKEVLALNNNTNRNQVTTVRNPIGRINTVCSAASCSHFDQHNVTEKHYKICHNGCTCVRAKLGTCQEVRLQNCSCINKSTLTCTTCGCFWITHMQIDYELVMGTGQVTDLTVKNRIATHQGQIAAKKTEIVNVENRKGGNTAIYQQMSSTTTEFAAFLKKNGILPYNTYKKEYLEKLLNEEKGKVDKSTMEIQLLEDARDDHDHQVAIIDDCKTESLKTAEELEKTTSQLRTQLQNWNIQSDIAKMELLKVRNVPMMRSTMVNLNDGWIGSLFE